MAVSDLKRKNEGVQDDVPRRLGAIELDSRRRRVEDRLVGLKLQGELDVSDRLIELCVAVWEVEALSYIPWSSCTAQSTEIRGLKKHIEWDTDERGFPQEGVAGAGGRRSPIVHRITSSGLSSSAEGSLWRWRTCWATINMRGLPRSLFGALMKEPKMGKLKVSREQLLEADQEVFFAVVS